MISQLSKKTTKIVFITILILVFFYIFNLCTPLYTDDYSYSISFFQNK